MEDPKRFVVETISDGDDVMIPFPPEVLKELDWKEGDTIDWKDNKDGSFTLTKKVSNNTELVLVETVSVFRMRYVVEVPTGKKDWATDTVVSEYAKEFSQKHLDETIVSHRVISEEDVLRMCDEDNDYAISWDVKSKLNAFVTAWNENS